MSTRVLFTSLLAGSMLASTALAQDSGSLDHLSMYGINRTTGELNRYNFGDQQFQAVGVVHQDTQAALLGIDASAYVPGYQNIFAFWSDPADQLAKLVYVNCETAQATVVGQDLGIGTVTAATSVLTDGSDSWLATDAALSPIAGTININPNNSPNHEFTLVTNNGDIYTRDDLHSNSAVDAQGNFFVGQATNIRVQPKGNGNQNGLVHNGVTYPLSNGQTYLISGQMNVRVYNDQISGNGKAMGHWWVAIEDGNAAINGNVPVGTGPLPSQWAVVALQSIEAQEDPTISFDITADHIVPTEPYVAKIAVLGAAISYGMYYDIPVSVQINVGGQTFEPFGAYGTAINGNVNDVANPRQFILPDTYNAGTDITVFGRSWVKKKLNRSGVNESHWQQYMAVSSISADSPQLIVLRHGDAVPNMAGVNGQDSVETYLYDYIDATTNTVVLDENQAIYLFELGTTDLTSSAADFQDLVVIVTLAKNVTSLLENEDDDGISGAASRLLLVDHQTGGYQQLMTLNRIYDALAWTSGKTFYATMNNALYLLDPVTQTETLVGTMPFGNAFGLEFAGQSLMGFEIDQDTLQPINHADASSNGAASLVGMYDLGTIVFVPHNKDPANLPDAFD